MRGNEDIRIISGNVLTGTKVKKDGYLGAYDNQITVIPEGDETHDFFGWATPGFGKVQCEPFSSPSLVDGYEQGICDRRPYQREASVL